MQRCRPARPKRRACSGSAVSSLILAGQARLELGDRGRVVGLGRVVGHQIAGLAVDHDLGMPPTAEATTAVSQAIASRLTMPSGSYTEGQAKTVACDSTWRTWPRGSISSIHSTLPRLAFRWAKASPNWLGDLRRVGGAGQQHHLGVGVELLGRADQVDQPFCRVIRPTKTTDGRSRSMPRPVTMSVPVSGANSSVSMPFLTTCTLSGSRSV